MTKQKGYLITSYYNIKVKRTPGFGVNARLQDNHTRIEILGFGQIKLQNIILILVRPLV